MVFDALARLFGDRAAAPAAYHDLVWAREEYTGGAYGSFNPPGVLTGVAAFSKSWNFSALAP